MSRATRRLVTLLLPERGPTVTLPTSIVAARRRSHATASVEAARIWPILSRLRPKLANFAASKVGLSKRAQSSKQLFDRQHDNVIDIGFCIASSAAWKDVVWCAVVCAQGALPN